MVLVTGATGFVGQTILKMCKDAIACPSLQNLTKEQVYRTIRESGADTIIHTAAIADTGLCAADPNASYQANVQLPVWIAEAAKGAKLICFSSDQVYSGLEEEGPYTEDLAKPGNVYAAHKLEMEQRVLDIAPDGVMLRADSHLATLWRKGDITWQELADEIDKKRLTLWHISNEETTHYYLCITPFYYEARQSIRHKRAAPQVQCAQRGSTQRLRRHTRPCIH